MFEGRNAMEISLLFRGWLPQTGGRDSHVRCKHESTLIALYNRKELHAETVHFIPYKGPLGHTCLRNTSLWTATRRHIDLPRCDRAT